MKKTHEKYLNKMVNIAINHRNSPYITSVLDSVKTPKAPIYGLIRDIVGDVRFTSVLEDDYFWRKYAEISVKQFIDSISAEEWQDIKLITEKKEEFLTNWLIKHIFTLSMDEKSEIEQEFGISGDEGEENDVEFNDIKMGVAHGAARDLTNNSKGINQASLPVEMKDIVSSAKTNAKGAKGEEHQTDIDFLNSIDPSVVELARKIGRRGGESVASKGKFLNASRSDISGITMGNDLNSLLPIELAMLAERDAEKVFLQRFVQRRLQVFATASHSTDKGKLKSGSIYICIDTSSSMSGNPEMTAKKLAYAIAVFAQKERRPVCVINYSFSVSFFVLRNLAAQRRKFLSFLSVSYGGGNDEEALFDFVFSRLPKMKEYACLSRIFDGADFLIISDFWWGGLSDDVMNLIKGARDGGMRFYGLLIRDACESSVSEMFLHDNLAPGMDFFQNCDFKYASHGLDTKISKYETEY
ncbi:MAG: hypothetical protein ACI30S_00435 [Muribaculaceae bacterium]